MAALRHFTLGFCYYSCHSYGEQWICGSFFVISLDLKPCNTHKTESTITVSLLLLTSSGEKHNLSFCVRVHIMLYLTSWRGMRTISLRSDNLFSFQQPELYTEQGRLRTKGNFRLIDVSRASLSSLQTALARSPNDTKWANDTILVSAWSRRQGWREGSHRSAPDLFARDE